MRKPYGVDPLFIGRAVGLGPSPMDLGFASRSRQSRTRDLFLSPRSGEWISPSDCVGYGLTEVKLTNPTFSPLTEGFGQHLKLKLTTIRSLT